MFEVAWSEIFIVLIVAIIVVGPKELPGMLRTFGRMIGKLRRAADDFRRQFDESVREAGGEDLQKELDALRRNNPLNDIRATIENAAREASHPPLPTPDTYVDKPEQPPTTTAAAASEAKPAELAPPSVGSPPAMPAIPEPVKDPQPQVSPGHEPVINGQHRPLS